MFLTTQRLILLPLSAFSKYNMLFQALTCCFLTVLENYYDLNPIKGWLSFSANRPFQYKFLTIFKSFLLGSHVS